MKTKRPTPRQRVANHLLNLGYKLNDEDIQYVHGGIHKRLSDIVECWSLSCTDPNDKEVQITSAHTLTECAAGIALELNTRASELYGDLIAVPKRERVSRSSPGCGAASPSTVPPNA